MSVDRWLHNKSDRVYTVLHRGRLQIDDAAHDGREVVVYVGDDGKVWVRPAAEFVVRFRPEGLEEFRKLVEEGMRLGKQAAADLAPMRGPR